MLRIDTQMVETIQAHRDCTRSALGLARDALVQMGIGPERRLRCYPHELSGGMRQRMRRDCPSTTRPRDRR